MNLDRVYTDGPVRAVVMVGLPPGVLFGLFQLVMTGSAVRALAQGLFVGVVFGTWSVWEMRRRWRRSLDLAPDDRLAVVGAVRRGEDIRDERLADAVVGYAGVVRRAQERDARLTWLGVAVVVLASAYAIAATVAGSTGEAVLFWVLTGLLVVSLTWLLPRRRARALANARLAEQAARSLSPR